MDRGLDRRGRREERKQSLYIYLTSTSVNWRAGRQFRILRRRIPPQDCKRNDRANSFAAHFSTEALISTSRARDIPLDKSVRSRWRRTANNLLRKHRLILTTGKRVALTAVNPRDSPLRTPRGGNRGMLELLRDNSFRVCIRIYIYVSERERLRFS